MLCFHISRCIWLKFWSRESSHFVSEATRRAHPAESRVGIVHRAVCVKRTLCTIYSSKPAASQHSAAFVLTAVHASPSFDNMPENWIWRNLGPFHSHIKASLSIFIVSPQLTELMPAIGLTADTCVHQQFLFRTSLTLMHTSGRRPVKNR